MGYLVFYRFGWSYFISTGTTIWLRGVRLIPYSNRYNFNPGERNVDATVGIDRPAGKQVAKYSHYNNGTKDDTTNMNRLPGNQLAMYSRYNNRTITSSILAKYSQ